MKYNYHTHTDRCFHAVGSDEEYVLSAIAAGFDEIGFSDHTPWPFKDGYVSGMRMSWDRLGDYADSIHSLREKYKDKISIKLGLECEYLPKYIPELKQAIKEHGIDYIILGHHFCGDEKGAAYNGMLSTPEEILRYRDDIVEAMDTGLFAYVAHPDIYMLGYGDFDSTCEQVARDIVSKAVETGTPLEYNLLGYKRGIEAGRPGYPHPKFWETVAELKPPVTVGIDAHYPTAYEEYDVFMKGYENLKSLGLTPMEKLF